MNARRILSILLSAMLALGALSLTACGGSSNEPAAETDTSATSDTKTPAGPTDEELIIADIEKVVGTSISEEEMLKGLRDDPDMLALEEQGLDLEAYASNMAGKFKLEVTSVDIDGDTAVAHTSLTSPEFGEEADALMDKYLEEATADIDLESMSEEEAMALMMKIVSDVLTDPEFPTTTSTFDIDYVKNNGTWEMKDRATVESGLSEITGVE